MLTFSFQRGHYFTFQSQVLILDPELLTKRKTAENSSWGVFMREIISDMCQTVSAQQKRVCCAPSALNALCSPNASVSLRADPGCESWIISGVHPLHKCSFRGFGEISLQREQKAAALWPCVGWCLSEYSGTRQKQNATSPSCSNTDAKPPQSVSLVFISHCSAHRLVAIYFLPPISF